MRITVFGATGRVGRRVVAEALSRGHEVTGVARDATRLGELQSGVDARIGNANSVEDIVKLSAGQDVVINAMGPSPGKESEVVKTSRTLIEGLARTGVRLLVSGGAASLVVPGTNGTKVINDPRYLPLSARDVAQASMDQYNVCFSEESVDWAYLSPPAHLVPGARTGKYRFRPPDLWDFNMTSASKNSDKAHKFHGD